MCLLASPRLYPLFSCLVKAYTQRLTICFYGINMSNIDLFIYILLTRNSLKNPWRILFAMLTFFYGLDCGYHSRAT